MVLPRERKHAGGFTLIELMVVIAIIGILAAIAIPNFVAFRNKSFCSAAQYDADVILDAIADYFAIPANSTITTAALTGTNATNKVYVNVLLSNQNTWRISAANPTSVITIQVRDASGRCPADYQLAMTQANHSRAFWDGANTYTKVMMP